MLLIVGGIAIFLFVDSPSVETPSFYTRGTDMSQKSTAGAAMLFVVPTGIEPVFKV